MKIYSKSKVNAYTFDQLSEKAQQTALNSDDLQAMLDGISYDRADESLDSLKFALNSINCVMEDYSISSFEYSYVTVGLDKYGEDNFSCEGLEAYTGHMYDIPKCESNGYYVSEFIKNRWSEVQPDLQQQVDGFNSKIDEYFELYENNDEVIDEVFDSDSSPFFDSVESIKEQYLSSVQSIVDEAVDMIQTDLQMIYDEDEIERYLIDAQIQFDEDGML